MIQIVVFAVVSAILIVYLKSINSEFFMLAIIGASVIIISYSIKYILNTFDFINQMIDMTGVDKDLYVIVFKVVAIGYLVEFGAGIIKDFGLNSLADKLVFVGKLVILSVSLPVFYAVFNLLSEFLI